MSDDLDFGLPPVPPMTPERARDVARSYLALARHFDELRVPREAAAAQRSADTWFAYATTLAQTKPGEGAAA
jgi:hypothetical protein